MNINSTQLLSAFDQTRTLVAAEPESSGDFTTVEKVFEEKRSTPDAVVMVYGVYNAGKSTLINVLLGKEEAECDDIPLTDKVTSYAWGKFSILDTPGVDAPIEHQNVTKQQLLSADAVIFVVNPLGTVEEAKTLQVLVDLLERGKQVFLVFNEKKQLSDDDFVKLKDQVREQIQILANDRGMGGVLKQVPIVRINAKQALFGRLKNVPELIERSGFPTLESQLLDFLNSISPNDVYGNLKHLLVSYLNTQVEHLTSTAPESGLVKKYDVFLRNLAREKAALRTDLLQKIDSEAREIRQRTKRVLRLDSDNAQSNIEALLTQASKGIEQHLEYRLQEIVAVAQGEIDALQASVPKVESYTHNAEVQFEMEGTDTAESTSGKRERPTISPEMLTEISKQLGSAAKPEHIVNVLAGVKKVLPSLM